MSEFAADTTAIAAFAARTATMAAQADAALASASGDAGIVGPVFGVIGGDFVTAFTAARSAHTRQLDHLASAWAATSTAAARAAAAYEITDSATATDLGATGEWL